MQILLKLNLCVPAKDYYWTSFRAFYGLSDGPLAVDHDWWWPDDSEKLSQSMKELGWRTTIKEMNKSGGRPPSLPRDWYLAH
jgi:hypothetical protein